MNNNEIKIRIANNLMQTRKEVGMTQKALAEATGLDQSYVSRLEKGEAEGHPAQWVSMANALHVPMARFFRGCQPGQIISSSGLRLTLDIDGYPTEDSLDTIRTYPGYQGNWASLMRAIMPLFDGYGRCESDDGIHWQVATGGWSGCESVIGALQDNHLFWALCWQLSKRGGYYEFVTKPIEGDHE